MKATPPSAVRDHRLVGVPFVESPNQDDRPDPGDLSLIVIHAISLPPGHFGGPDVSRLFLNVLDPKAHPYFETIHTLRVSAHLFIRRQGDLIQFVSFDRRAWHAGLSTHEGRDRCNDFSIGIELEGTEDREFEDVQYETLSRVLNDLYQTYPRINPSRVVGHQHISPGRKWDPGPCFEWARIGIPVPT